MKGAIHRQYRSRAVLVGLSVVAGVIAAYFAWDTMRGSIRRLQAARDELSEARQLIGEIDQLQTAPRVASLEMESPDEISKRVTAAMQALRNSPASLQSVDPQSPVRIGKSEYQLRATELELNDVRVGELARFVTRLVESGQGVQVRDMVLSEPANASKSKELWTARLTLTQVIFSPISR